MDRREFFKTTAALAVSSQFELTAKCPHHLHWDMDAQVCRKCGLTARELVYRRQKFKYMKATHSSHSGTAATIHTITFRK